MAEFSSLDLPMKLAQYSHHSQQDHLLRSHELIQNYKELSLQFAKYQSKSSSTSRCNLLRLTLLSFLRSDIQLSLPTNLNSLPLETITEVLTGISQGVQLFAKYWLSLLAELFKNWTTISFVDKTCYLECISRLMSRNEWIHSENHEIYKDLLILTLNLIFKKLFNLKLLSISLNAFIGKVFAYSFFYLPKFAEILLFSLFIKNRSINEFEHFKTNTNLKQYSKYPNHLINLINYNGDYSTHDEDENNSSSSFLNNNCMFPPRYTNFIIQVVDEQFVNEFPEYLEQHEQLSIDLKDSNWVKRWAGFDSDIFKSFLKHYLEICLYFQEDQIKESQEDFNKLSMFIENQPGGILIYLHQLQIFDSNFRMLKNFKKCQSKENSGQNNNINNEMVAFYSSNLKSNMNKNYQIYLSNISFLKIFKILETLIYSSVYVDVNLMIKYFESILLLRAKVVSSFSPEDCEVMYDLLLEICLKLNNNSKKPMSSNIGQIISNNDLLIHINWEFWVIGLIQMINTSSMICIAKSLSSLFNLWEMIPHDCYFNQKSLDLFSDSLPQISKDLGWIIDRSYTLLYNLSMFLISDPIWENLFIHWQPLIRHFYHRLVIFKIVGINNESKVFKKNVSKKISQTFELFIKYVNENKNYNQSLLKFEILPSMPIFNKKLIITYSINDSISLAQTELSKTSSTSSLSKRDNSYVNILDKKSNNSRSSMMKNSYSSSNLVIPSIVSTKRVYSFDIFDDAIYSSSASNSVSNSPYPQSSSRSPSGGFDGNKSNSNSPIPRAFSKSSLSSMRTRSSSMSSSPSKDLSRSSSASTLKKVPIISSALSFFKKVNDSISNESDSQLDVLKPPTIPTTPTTPPTPKNTFDNNGSLIDHKYSGSSTPSSVSEISDSENSQFQFQNGLVIKSSSPLLTVPKSRTKQLSSSSSRVSSTSSLISMVSQNSNINTSATSNGNSTYSSAGFGYSGYSMESIPPPPELSIKIPPSKSFKYKYQLIFSKDSFQNTFYRNKLSNEKRNNNNHHHHHHLPNHHEISRRKAFFRMDEIIDNVNDVIPPKPRLPRIPKSIPSIATPNLNEISGVGLISSSMDEKEEFENDVSDFESDNDDDVQDILNLNGSKLTEWFASSVSSNSSISSLNFKKKSIDGTLYSSVSNLDKNWTILGKVITEWNLVTEEYEKYLDVLINDEKIELKNDEFYQWLKDPMLMCDIPPTKNMFGDKDIVYPK